MDIIDLRSDTVTQPTPEMRRAMAEAEVGDDVYGEDPTVNRLQELAAERMGKPAALFVPSGTMGNLLAFLTHCQRGDEAILGLWAHPFQYEAGGMAALGSIIPHTIPNQPDGTLALEDIRGAIRMDDPHFPRTRLVALENTNNRCNGVPLTADYVQSVADLAHQNGLMLHIDGARIFNAAIALGVPAAKLVSGADSVTFCLSKGLCAPAGSLLCSSRDFIARALRIRKQLGGGMRQAGILAAAGLVALDSMVDRLAEDHERARQLADGLRAMGIFDLPQTHTNIMHFNLNEKARITPQQLQEGLKQAGVLIGYADPRGFRAVTHYWIDDQAVERTLEAFSSVLQAA
jgi:threonine aldolase